MIFRKNFFLLLFVLSFFSLKIAFAAKGANAELDDLLLFEVHLDRSILADGLNTYREGSFIFLPLSELANILTLAVVVDPQTKTAEGFVISEERKFFLDLKTNSVLSNDKKSNFESKLVRMQGNEIYIESSLFSEWFPVSFSIDVPGLMLRVTPKEQLPIQARLSRNNKAPVESDLSAPDFKNYDTPYSIIDKPFIDHTMEGSIVKPSNSKVINSGRFTTLISGDFLGLETRLIGNGNDEKGLVNYRYSLGRDDPDGNLLGFAKARTFAIGNVNLPSVNYIIRPTSLGRGGFVSSRPLTRPTRFDTQSFTGDLLPGWDVELFQNGILIGYQSSNERSLYEFNDIPLYFGGNNFRLIFHGPAGQIREEQSRFMLEDSMVLPGETYYSLGSVRFEDGSARTLLQLDQSLSNQISATAGFISQDGAADEILNSNLRSVKTYANFGLRSFWNSLFLSLDSISSDTGGSLGAATLKTGFWNSTFSLSHVVLDNFVSEEFLFSSNPEISRTKARFDTYLPFFDKLPLSIEGSRSELASHQELSNFSAKVSTYLKGVSISNRFRYSKSPFGKTTTGELQLSSHVRRLSIRGGLNYDLSPSSKITSIDLSGNIRLNSEYNFTQSISNQMQSRETRFEAGLNKEVGKYGIGLSVGGTSQAEQFISFRFNVALGVEPRNSEFVTSAQSMSTTGALSARTYLDKNMNGKYDPNDELVPRVGFRVDRAMAQTRTDEKGIVFLSHLPTGKRLNVGIDPATIDDPQVTPFMKGVRMLPRAGKIAQLDFPLILTTEIDGVVSVNDGNKMTPASRVNLELVEFADREQIVSRATTAFDGYYIFTEVPPGKYIIRVEPEQAGLASTAMSELKMLRILPNSNFINGMNLVIKKPQNSNIKKLENLPTLIAPTTENAEQELHFVILGSYALEQSFQPVLSQLQQLKVPYVTHVFSRPLNIYRIQIEFDTLEKAQESIDTLTRYKYTFGKQVDGSHTKIFIGPYYSQNEIKMEKAVLQAALPTFKLNIFNNLESINMTEVAVGGFASLSEATQFATEIKKFNFTEISIQKRSGKQWNISK